MQDGSPKILAWIDEEECEYEELSSGEKQIIDLAVLIAFNNLIAKKFNQDNGILGSVFLDEVFCYLDPENAELANSILAKSVATLVMVVTHDHNLQDHFNNKLHVSKKGGSAVYQLLV
jgi:DNA repair exonuclease SbcCD ATPase subunit